MHIPQNVPITLDLSPVRAFLGLAAKIERIPALDSRLVVLVTILKFSILSQLQERRFVEALKEVGEANTRLTRVLRQHLLIDGVQIPRELLWMMEESGLGLQIHVAKAIRPIVDELESLLSKVVDHDDLYRVIELYEKVKNLFLRAENDPLSFL